MSDSDRLCPDCGAEAVHESWDGSPVYACGSAGQQSRACFTAQIAALTAELTAARAENERLTKERDEAKQAEWRKVLEIQELRKAVSTPDKLFASQLECAAADKVRELSAENERLREKHAKFDRRLHLLECGDDASWEEFDGLDSIELVAFLRREFSGESPVSPAAAPSDLHQAIMNIQCSGQSEAYTRGHRDARHDAAELVAAAADGVDYRAAWWTLHGYIEGLGTFIGDEFSVVQMVANRVLARMDKLAKEPSEEPRG